MSHKRALSGANETFFPISYHKRALSTLPPQLPTTPKPVSRIPSPAIKNSEFLGLLDAAATYFTEALANPWSFPDSDLDSLSKSLSSLLTKNSELSKSISSLQLSYSELCLCIETQKKSKETLEDSIRSLKLYNSQLDADLLKNSTLLKSLKNSQASSTLLELSRTQLSSPMPIKYKPLSKRVARPLSDSESPQFL